MSSLIEFLSLRPIWTRRGLEVLWWAYAVATLSHLGWSFHFLLWSNVSQSSGLSFPLIYSAVFAVVQLALVRIILELALKFLIDSKEEANAQRP